MAEVLQPSDRMDDKAYIGEINPSFSFPMSSPSTISPRSQVPVPSRSRPADITIQPTPSFTFPPPLTPPPIPEPSTSSPNRSRPAGHRRGPSEFIGGDGSTLGPGLMSTSPTKGENALPAPGMSGGRRRGHAHRRSAAISHHDLNTIITRPDSSSRRTGSAPATPSVPNMQFARPHLDRARSQPELPSNNPIDPSKQPESAVKSSSTETSPATATRPRVGFSDKLEYIPRPLSFVSSATSSSVSTIRASHSLNDSITSLRSLGTSSPPSVKRDHSSEDIFGGNLHDADGSPSRDAEGRFGKGSTKSRRYSPPPPVLDRPISQEGPSEDANFLEYSPVPQLQTDLSRLRGVPDLVTRPRTSPEPSDSKRSKHGKSWGDFLSRKPEPDFAPQEFISLDTELMPEGDIDLDGITFDEDSTYVVRSPEFDVARSVNSNPSPRVPTFDTEPDVAGVLDLDDVWNKAGMTSSSSDVMKSRYTKRALHSSGATGGFSGPGMHYHRRAESAPVMPPVDYGLGFPRAGSNPLMADVFEEDEDDYNQNSLSRQVSRQKKEAAKTVVTPLAVSTEEPEPVVTELASAPSLETISKTTVTNPRPPNFSLPNRSSDRSLKKNKDLAIHTSAIEPRTSLLSASNLDNTSPVPTQPSSIRNYASSHGSYPSQSDRISNFHGSSETSPLQTSFEVPRLGTAHSSGTERSTWSSARTGENVQATSLDDVPSLVSSSSTMISHLPHTPVVGSRPLYERSYSLSGEAAARPRTPLQAAKRASLASLSKLMGGSFSEKSKLSIESRAEDEDDDDSNKTKKRNRISRLLRMRFWKSKEDVRSLASRDGPKTA